MAPRPHAGFIVTLAAHDGAQAEIEIDVGVRTDSPEDARDRGLRFTETLMPDLRFRPVAMRHADDRDLKSGESVAQLGPIRHTSLPEPGLTPPP
ncbi:hypothetical protein KUH32_11630 [Thalassococcus sp. CAU 1522]|uniref:Uncharacterized protein n=1 Tax=Thalassococcus arenae TaxID=2851652 RepID=A0ABS6N8U0_9RHOB|nr:hypothetical protein [Thalassococcus arenae]MBV2360427.1 hypothetical protein [Thalassococcus arenae]